MHYFRGNLEQLRSHSNAFVMDTNYYIPVNSFVSKYVSVFWQVDGYPFYSCETIIPQGIIEIIFNFSEDPSVHAIIGKQKFRVPECFINGYNTNPIVMQIGPCHSFFGIRLYPHTAGELFSVPAGKFSNQVIDLTLLDSTIKSIWHQLKEEKDFKRRVSIFSRWISTRPLHTLERNMPIVDFLNNSSEIKHNPASLSKVLFYSPRHLSRKFVEFTGMNMEEYLQYKKYLHAVNLMHFTEASLTSIAYECNFFDQSHFIKVFRHYTHLTPGEYRKLQGNLPGHIYQ